MSHDQVTRWLSTQEFTSRDLWLRVKSAVRSAKSEAGVLIFDDTIQEKAWTDENELMCWHFDHVSGRSGRGINPLNAPGHSNVRSIPVAFEVVKKPIQFSDLKTRQVKRRSEVTKNELMQQMITTCINNALKFRFVLTVCWFASVENFEFIRGKKRLFIAALKGNRLIALSQEDRNNKCYTRVDELNFSGQTAMRCWLKDYDNEILVVRQVFTNKDGGTGILHLVCSDLTCDHDTITTTYKKRWQVEVFHKALNSNANLAKSPIQTVRTQSNHVFVSICATFKLECLSLKAKLNPFALCRTLLINATRSAYAELQLLNATA